MIIIENSNGDKHVVKVFNESELIDFKTNE